MYPRTAESSERLKEIMGMPISIIDQTDGIRNRNSWLFSIENVTFAILKQKALFYIFPSCKPGETITAFIGSTGSR